MPQASVPRFRPKKVFVDKAVVDLSYTQEILSRLGEVPCELIDDPQDIRTPMDMTWDTKGLLLTQYQSQPLKELTMNQTISRKIFSLDLISNCHLKCSYCILQSRIADQSIITLYTNLDEIMNELQKQFSEIPQGSIVGTGQTGDSLALEDLTRLNQRLIPFFGTQDRITLELKTRCANVASLLSLDHNGKTVVSWSMVPENVQAGEESQTAPIQERIEAIQACQNAGYPVGLHFDPIIHHTGWEKNYKRLINQLFSKIGEDRVYWVSIGTLRFPVKQVAMIRKRYPNSRRILRNLISKNHIMDYPERLQNAIYGRMREYLHPYVDENKVYISTET